MKKIFIASIIIPILLIAPLMILPATAGFGNRRGRYNSDWNNLPNGYVNGIALDIGDGEDWFFAGPTSPPDIPGHAWKQTSQKFVSGLHLSLIHI